MTSPLALAVLVPTALVVVAMSVVLWRERRSAHDARVAIAGGIVLALWAVAEAILARRGFFQPAAGATVPPIGVNLIVVLPALAFALAASPTLRRLLSNQGNLIRLHVWRLEGLVFPVSTAASGHRWNPVRDDRLVAVYVRRVLLRIELLTEQLGDDVHLGRRCEQQVRELNRVDLGVVGSELHVP